MNKCIGYILAFYVLLNAVVPCSIFDNCEKEQLTGQNSHKDHKKDCSDCSPFSICAAHGFTISTNTVSVKPEEFYTSSSYKAFYFSPRQAYLSRLFQPPRMS
jgi:hypothetical protein